LITIITSNLNNTNLLSVTASSIRAQSFRCKWIIVDGGSTDGIMNFYDSNTDIISGFISEKDSGIYNAWNKAIKLLDTDWVLFLGAGDVLYDEFSIERSVGLLNPSYFICYGNVQMVDGNGQYREFFGEINTLKWEQCRPQTPHHQGVFHNSSIFKSFVFDESYKIGGDSKLVLEAMKLCEPFYINANVAMMRTGGVSYRLESLSVCLKENRRIVRELGLDRSHYKSSFLGDLKLYLKVILFKIIGGNLLLIIDFYRAITGRQRSSYER